mgnify:CR=1 FL=1
MPMPLAFAREGATLRILEVRAGRGLAHRISELGLTPGSVVKVVKASPPGPIIVEVDGYDERGVQKPVMGVPSAWRLALGFGMAMKIMVEDLS